VGPTGARTESAANRLTNGISVKNQCSLVAIHVLAGKFGMIVMCARLIGSHENLRAVSRCKNDFSSTDFERGRAFGG